MKEFSLLEGWSSGIRFLSGQAANHAIILIGMGVLLPFVLQLALVGVAAGTFNPVAAGASGMAGAGGAAMAAMTIGYVLQTGSLFASWRLGFAKDETLAGAVAFGLLAGLLTVIGSAVSIGVLGFGLAQLTPVLGMVVGAIAFLLLFAVFATTIAALLAAGICLAFGLAMLFGTAMGNTGLAATMAGGSGLVVVILIVAAGLLFWLAARFSCTTALLAERRSLNLFAAMGESWRLTWEDEWRITRYLALIGFALAIILLLMVAAVGVAFSTSLEAGSPTELGIGGAILQVVLGIPLIGLAVLVPAGIYRELAGAPAPVEVFA